MLYLYPVKGGHIFLRNVATYVTNQTAIYTRNILTLYVLEILPAIHLIACLPNVHIFHINFNSITLMDPLDGTSFFNKSDLNKN
jgi:hypothetical protein